MRFLTIAVLAFVMMASSAFAQGSTRTYGYANCRQPVPCPTDAESSNTSAMAASATACISQYFGYAPPPDGFFDESASLDAESCLTARPNVIPKGVGAQLSPLCCILPPTDPEAKSCTLRCSLKTIH